jgi:periplasmic nitrate reductase NapD
MTELHIASCVVRVRAAALNEVIAAVESIIGTPISAINADGKLVVLIEGENTGELLDQMDKIRAVPQVLSVEMVYQHAESKSLMEELIQ